MSSTVFLIVLYHPYVEAMNSTLAFIALEEAINSRVEFIAFSRA